MVYRSKADLEEIRKSQNNIKLYAVYSHLALPVFKIKSLSKKYVYWEDNSKHPYPSNSAGYILTDNLYEGWKIYKDTYNKRKKFIEDQYKSEIQKLTMAESILDSLSKSNPELFI